MRLIKSLWGVQQAAVREQWDAMFAKAVAQGFNGVEVCSPGPFYPFAGHDAEMITLVKKHKLSVVMQLQTLDYPLGPAGWKEHAEDLRRKAEACTRTFGHRGGGAGSEAGGVIDFFNVHGGKDSFRADDVVRFFEEAAVIERDIGVPMVHETHRQRALHSPFVIRDTMAALPPTLRINADLSHFVVALERLMCVEKDAEFWPQVLDWLSHRTNYIHARVGFAQGIQVPHPSAPEFAQELAAHCAWWQLLAQGMQQRSVEITVCPEYGPWPYMPHLPFTNVPVADLDDVVASFGCFMRTQCRGRLEGIEFQR